MAPLETVANVRVQGALRAGTARLLLNPEFPFAVAPLLGFLVCKMTSEIEQVLIRQALISKT